MKNGDMPAMPAEIQLPSDDPESSHYPDRVMPCAGLTKREMFAMAAMQGLISDPNMTLTGSVSVAVEAADLLLRRLDSEDINPPIMPDPDWPEEDE